MEKEWDTIDLEVKPYKDVTFIVGGIDEIIALLDDHIVKVNISSFSYSFRFSLLNIYLDFFYKNAYIYNSN